MARKKKQKLPLGVGCLATLMLLASLLLITLGVLYYMHINGNDVLGSGKAQWAEFDHRYGQYGMLALFAFGVVTLPIAIGLFARQFWAYCAYTVMNGLNLGLAGYRLIAHHQLTAIPSIAINVCILIYMFMPGVKKAFS